MASDPNKIRKLVEDIMRDENGENKELTILKGKLEVNTVLLHQLFSDYRKKLSEMTTLQEELQSVGNKEGISQEVKKLESSILTIKLAMKDVLSDTEVEEYERQKSLIVGIKSSSQSKKTSNEELTSLMGISLFNDIGFSISTIPDEVLRSRVVQIYEKLKNEFNDKWNKQLEFIIQECEQQIQTAENQIECILADPVYVKANRVYQQNSKLVEENDKLEKEKNKLAKIERLSEKITQLQQDAIGILEKILQKYEEYFSVQKEYCDQHIIHKGDVTITPRTVFQADAFQQSMSGFFDARNAKNSKILYLRYSDQATFMRLMKEVLKELLKNEYVLKSGNTASSVAEDIFSSNPFAIEYNINYQGDDLTEMSEGKTAFVILRLLLDFSMNEYPILIDQPEDDLDNRAIFGDLVTYLREKKKQRQIILVTHNPNVVVGADAEEIIVANQQGIGNGNPNNVKFAYRSGALEESFIAENDIVLFKQGIRQQVCDLLEGGYKAFQLREQKYQL
jgi:hypothetical protein